jgi:hypothetical protein
VNLQLPNPLISNHHSPHISIVVHHHLINLHCHLLHFLLILFMVHHHIHHLIAYHPITTVMVSMVHPENLAMNNNIKIFFMIVFFFIWLLLIDNNIYHLMVILYHQMVYGVQDYDLSLVSTQFYFFTTCKIHCNPILSILVTRLVTSNYNRITLIALTFLFSHSLPYILQLKVKCA